MAPWVSAVVVSTGGTLRRLKYDRPDPPLDQRRPKYGPRKAGPNHTDIEWFFRLQEMEGV